jgi:hypothetical protein
MRKARDDTLESLRQDMVAWAQEYAPWRDVTGDARAELHSPAVITHADGSKSVILAHGVSYGTYLETRDGGALGIIAKTIRHFVDEFPQRLRSRL